MISAGIEAMNVFGGTAYIDVQALAAHRKLDLHRFENLMMKEKTVALPYEDPVTFAVNAAKPIIDKLSQKEKDQIELLITCTESGIDAGKSLSTYIHDYLGLNHNCRLFELKNACYAGTAGYQMGLNFILSQTSPGAKALMVATDISRFIKNSDQDFFLEEWNFAETSAGAGAVAVLISDMPCLFQADIGANGYYGYEVMDTCRPAGPDTTTGDADLSLMSYLDCCEQTFEEYCKRVSGVNYQETFQYLAFHTPFGGMIKGAHRNMMRKKTQANPTETEKDFELRVMPGLIYCQRVGNIMGGTVFLSLASIIDNGIFDSPKRIGCFSYGSGCCAEFYSGVVTSKGQGIQNSFNIRQHLNERYRLSLDEYETILTKSRALKFGVRNALPDFDTVPGINISQQNNRRLFLKEIKDFHRKYRWSDEL